MILYGKTENKNEKNNFIVKFDTGSWQNAELEGPHFDNRE